MRCTESILTRAVKMNDTVLAPLPTGTSDFETLRGRGQIYVDKTALIYELASRSEKFFLTRPRRFGKSLLVSTFASLFKNGLKYFSGLAIEKLWKDTTYNVVEIDFSEIKNITGFEDFKKQLNETLESAFKPLGFELDRSSDISLMKQLSAWMKTIASNSVVLLIDEYDLPLTACLGDKALFRSVRTRLASFYATVKANDRCFRFVFMTGIAKFNQTGIFSELNNFSDLSLDPRYGTFLGYSEDDIRTYFSGYLNRASQRLNLSPDDVLDRMRENYDGYCFDQQASTHVYAPWSVMKFLDAPELGFSNYWMKSGGTLTLLEKYLHSHALKSPTEYGEEQAVGCDELDASADFDEISDLVLLTQAGYLTIKRQEIDTFFVSYPNREVAKSMASLYARMLLKKKTVGSVGGQKIKDAVLAGSVEDLFSTVNKTFAAFDYVQHPIKTEKICQTFLLITLTCVGFEVISERHNALGRSDLEWDTNDHHWVIELKFQRRGQDANALLADAVRQIRDKNHGASSSKPLIRAAAVFSEEKRAFVGWQDADAD